MPRVKKSQQMPPPSKRQKKELEPRRSNRVPKISEKLKEYLDDQFDEDNNMKRGNRTPKVSGKLTAYVISKDGTQKHGKKKRLDLASDLLGERYKEAKVVLKALPQATVQNQIRRYTFQREPQVALKRLVNLNVTKKNTRVVTSKLRSTASRRAASSNSQSALKKEIMKAEVNQTSSRLRGRPKGRPKVQVTKRMGKRKRLDTDHEQKQPQKRRRTSTKGLKQEVKDDSAQDKRKSRFDPTVMKKLFSFGAKVEETLILNKKAMDKLVSGCKKAEAITEAINEKLEEADVDDLEKIINWIDEEERQRKKHREAVMESLKVTHQTNMELYAHMLLVLKSVTASA